MQNSCSRSELVSDAEMKEKYALEYPSYQAEAGAVESLKLLLKDIQVTIVLGKWCGDSQRQLPQFFKIADEAFLEEPQLRLICVDRSKQAQDGSTDGLQIEHVPTFIFSKNGMEIGRITELPITTLENDMVTILSK